MRKLQTLFLVLVSVLLITSCKGGSKKKEKGHDHERKTTVDRPKANPNNGKEATFEGYLIPNSFATMKEGFYPMCSLKETFEQKDPQSAVTVVQQIMLPFGKTPNSISYSGKGEDYTKVEIYDKDGNKFDCYSTKFKITGKMTTIEGSDNFILEDVVITKL